MKKFKAESQRLLDLMIHSIYTHKEIFLRELISNASDALDKLYYRSLTDENVAFDRDSFNIRLTADKENRTLTITDTGVGMTLEELEQNLGTIAKSGSMAFKSENEPKEGVEIIGQFGVGFYSAFMVADEVTVISRAFGTETAGRWHSHGADGYTVEPCERDSHGTDIILTLKANTGDENYDEYLQEYRLRNFVKKYSDFIKYPIKMEVSRTERDEDGTEHQKVEDETLNSMVPLWRRNRNELTQEDYDRFYADKHFGFDKPLQTIHSSVDGALSYTMLLYLPSKTPFDFYSKNFEKGLELYANGVLIMQKCGDLLPDYFSFVQGLVDCADLSLNISREFLQHDRQLRAISKKIREKIKSELLNLLEDDREKYEEFYQGFGRHLKFGLYDNWGAEKEVLQDLILFHSSTENKLVTLKEYIARMKEDQKFIYYASGDSVEKIARLPQAEALREQGFEILYFTEDVDEFAIRVLTTYDEKEFKSVQAGDLGLPDEDKSDGEDGDNTALLDFCKEALDGKVSEVKASTRLRSHPVCITSAGELSVEMEKVLAGMPGNPGAKAEKILEVNVNHPMWSACRAAFESDQDRLRKLVNVLYQQALLIEGLPIDDPVAYAEDVCSLF